MEFVTNLGGLSPDDSVLLAGMGGVEEIGPVVDRQGVVETIAGYGLAGGVEEELRQARERDARVAVESPGGLSGGPSGGLSRQEAQSRGGGMGVTEVLGHKPLVTFLQTLFDTR
jgi:hypothetical protein